MAAVVLGNARVLHPGKLRWLRALGWMVLLFIDVIVAFSVASGLAAGLALALLGLPVTRPDQLPGWVKAIDFTIGAVALLAAYAGTVRFGERRQPVELALRPAVPELLIGLALGAAAMLATGAVLWATGWAQFATQPIAQVGRAIANSIQSGVLEETLFRLVILRLLWRAFGVWPALALSALIFGLMHLANPNASWFAAICIALEAGIMLGAFYILTGRIWVSIGLHAGWNFTQGWVLGAAVSGTDGFGGGPLSQHPTPGVAAWLSGGGFGPEASLPALLLCTLLGLCALWFAWTRGLMRAADEA